MKLSKATVRGKATLGMELRFEPQNLTSYSGLILFQHFFSFIGIKERLWRCFRHLKANSIYGHHVMVMLLVVHLIIGHRRLRDLDYYRDDELVKRVLGLKRLPNVSTLSRSLSSADERSVGNVRAESRTGVIERLVAEGLASVTLDFDGSVLSTGRHAEGTAVGFNKKKKGARSYYPPCSAPSPRPTKCSTCTIDPETSTTPTAPTPSSSTVCASCASACLGPR